MASIPQGLSSFANRRFARPLVYAAVIAVVIFAGDWVIHGLVNAHAHDALRIEELEQDVAFAIGIGLLLYYLFSGFIGSAVRYRALAEGVRDMMVIFGSDHRIIDANDSAVRAYGWERDELLGLSAAAITADRETPSSWVADVLRDGAAVMVEGVHRRKDGTPFPVEVSASPGELLGERVVLAVVRDVSERRRRDTFTRMLHEADRAILGGEDLQSILSVAVRQLAAVFPGALVQIALRSDDHSVLIRQYAGAHEEFLDGIEVRWDDTPHGRGPTGRAIRTGISQTCDIGTDPGFLAWRERALACGFRKAFAIPLRADSEVLGAITLFSEREEGIGGEGLAGLQLFADQVALSIFSRRNLDLIQLQRLALESVANAVVVTDRDGVIEWANPAFTSLTGYALADARRRSMSILRSGSHEESFYRRMWDTILAGRVWRGEVYNRRKDGSLYLEEQTITPMEEPDGTISRFVAVKQDITMRRQHEERLRHATLHDTLTGLPNRSLLVEHLGPLVHRARRGSMSALVVVDVDDLKVINDTLGHLAGDRLLCHLTEVLSETIREGDVVARIGGDEFAVVMDGGNAADATRFAERLRESFAARPFRFGSTTSWVTVSVGLAMIDGIADTDILISRADSAVHAAKERGRNRVVAWDETGSNGGDVMEAGQWVHRIREALRGDGFTLAFQPVVDLVTGKADHFEVLLRMCGENGELIAPDRFMPAASRYGLSAQIDHWVVDKAIALLAERDGFRLFVNLAAESLLDEELLDLIRDRIEETGISPGRIAFEITETAAVADFAAARGWIGRAKSLGCMFAIDDFGVGFSSLSYLRLLSVDWVKIDKSFIADIHKDQTSRALVDAVKSVATTLGKEVIAEGVEIAEHAVVLREMGIRHGQGYHWGHPGPDVLQRVMPNEIAVGREFPVSSGDDGRPVGA